MFFFFFFQAEDGIRDKLVTGVQTCALPIFLHAHPTPPGFHRRRGLESASKEGWARSGDLGREASSLRCSASALIWTTGALARYISSACSFRFSSRPERGGSNSRNTRRSKLTEARTPHSRVPAAAGCRSRSRGCHSASSTAAPRFQTRRTCENTAHSERETRRAPDAPPHPAAS